MKDSDNKKEISVLIADDDGQLARRLADFLNTNGILTRVAANGTEAKNILRSWKPDFVLADLVLPELNAITFLQFLKQNNMLGEDKSQFFVLSGHNHADNVKECLRAGASDYIVKPLKHVDVLARLVIQRQEKRSLADFTLGDLSGIHEAQYHLHLTDLALKEATKDLSVDETLHNLTRMVSLALKAVRVSVVHCDPDARIGKVLGSSDKRDVGNLQLDLNKYPEILYVMNTQKLLALDNIAKDPTMAFVVRHIKSITFNSMIVCPIKYRNRMVGVLSARMTESKHQLLDFEIRFSQIVAHVAALTLLRHEEFESMALPPPARSAS